MKPIIIISLSLTLLFVSLYSSAQELNTKYTLSSQFLFNKFQPAVVDFKTKNSLKTDLNYNVLLEQVQFIKNGKILSIVNTEDIKAVKIGSKVFIPVEKKFYELVYNDTISILLRRTPDLTLLDDREGPFGVKLTTDSPDKLEAYLVNIAGNTNIQKINTPKDDQKEIPIYNRYYIMFQGEVEPAAKSRIKRMFSDNKKELKAYMKEQNIDLESISDLKRLADYLETNHL